MDSAYVAGVAGNGLAEHQIPQFFGEFWSRNEDILSEVEQSALRSARVLIAGCGTVGGALVEPLARMGVSSFVLADPEVYEVSNLNRQACTLADVGRPKAEVLADRVLAVNPFAVVMTLPEGITEENVDAALEDVSVVFDGIDAFASLWIKYLVHDRAAEQRTPVLVGVDLGGQPTVYVWDYRRKPEAFYGKVSAEAHRDGRTLDALNWFRYRAFPADFLPIIADRVTTGRPWPQVAYCSCGLGALVSRTIVDVLLARPVRHVIHADLHMLPQPLSQRVAARARWPLAAARALTARRRAQSRRPRGVPGAAPGGFSATVQSDVLAAFEAVRRAPSVHNTQPWTITMTGARAFRLGWDRRRALDVTDPSAQGACYSLGCALEAASAIVRLEIATCPELDPFRPEWYAADVTVQGVHASYPQTVGLLAMRGTNRQPFFTEPLAPNLLQRLERQAELHGASFAALTARADIDRIAAITEEATTVSLEQEQELEELLRWIRIGKRDCSENADGFTARTLRLDPATAAFVGLLKRSTSARRLANRAGLARVMGSQAGDALKSTGAVLLLSHEDASAQGCVRAGRALMAVWLEATRANLSLQPVSQALVLGRRSAEVRDLFGGSAREEPLAIVRIGRAAGPPVRSLRLPLDRIWTATPDHS